MVDKFIMRLLSSLIGLSLISNVLGASSQTSAKGSKGYEFPSVIMGKDIFGMYFLNATLGNPEQFQRLRLDIAQPYLWIPNIGSKCPDSSTTCNERTVYDPSSSNTSIPYRSGHVFDFEFIDALFANGSAYTDRFSFPNILGSTESYSYGNHSGLVEVDHGHLNISSMSFFSTYNSGGLSIGSLGLGGNVESRNSDLDSGQYDGSFFLLEELKEAGLIEGRGYSLWLGGDNTSLVEQEGTVYSSESIAGRLILGAVNPNLIDGKFVSFNMLPYQNPDTLEMSNGYPILPMGPINIISKSGASLNMTSNNYLQPVLLDSRYTNSRLPIEAIIQIAIQIDASYVEQLNSWVVSCSILKESVVLEFSFGPLRIKVPLKQFLKKAIDPDTGNARTLSNGDQACILSLYPNHDIGYNILGAPFMKSIYLAVDNEGGTIALGQSLRRFISEADNIEENTSGADIESTISEGTLSESTIPESTTTEMAITSSITSNSSMLERRVTANATANHNIYLVSLYSESVGSTIETEYPVIAISSAFIPYASTVNMTRTKTMKLLPDVHQASNYSYPVEFTATLNSNGVISQGHSFYNTDRTSSTTRSSSSQFASLSVRAPTATNGTTMTMSAAGYRLQPISYTENKMGITQRMSMLRSWVMVTMLALATGFLLFV
ncbi:hypothetical protein Kpol_1059p33 [Vanderwaltozyma polyspora DSM 70294]|uniref:Peptidase A1 domain-containing protein n=1 Tax=Vanderwaltozyma polyspora (strain ATCC 22028 / DSM 70294 / BCRC 21397 / CBS 2163 / NBRC 10782 / NRRL Y-8283 / UCD 57-17) TaxID=436907 RepID=A7TN37_VANPO|nr:uncharacterized protein Kpol_1059p33 [Vanderwaltozyma polyspora DSM 70294]EDO16343.1 hypothetical protein Kpol_1059p33 [Vanderwaltozyma polyspora DSM 70294]